MKKAKTQKENYLVSAIVSAYNSEYFIRSCLEDLVTQSLGNKLEIIVIDSGSEENEREIVEEFQKEFSNIVYIRTEKRESVYAAWNRGIESARGKYITNANTDDRHRKDALEIMAGELETDPETALVFGDQIITQTPNETFTECTPVGYFQWPCFDRMQLLHCSCVGPQPMWRRCLHDKFGYFDRSLAIAGDYEWWLRISDRCRFRHIPQLLGLYLLSNNGLEHSSHQIRDRETLKVQRYYAEKSGIKFNYNQYSNTFIVPKYVPKRGTDVRNNRDDPMVSVIIPTYNRPQLLNEALASVAQQTYRDLEVIVVNDGGVSVQDIIDRQDKEIDIIYIEHQEKRGPAAARNSALRKARGKYIAYLDDDDIFYPNHLETLINYLEGTGYSVAYSDSMQAFKKLDGPVSQIVTKKPAFGQNFDKNRLLVENYIPVINVVHRRDCIEEVGLFDEGLRTHEDWDLWIRMSQKFDFCHIRRKTAEFRTYLGSSSLRVSNRADFERTMRIIHSRYSKLAVTPGIRKAKKEALQELNSTIYQKISVTPIDSSKYPRDISSRVTVIIALINRGKNLQKILDRIRSQKRISEIEIFVMASEIDRDLEGLLDEFSVKAINISAEELVKGIPTQYLRSKSLGDYVIFTTDNVIPINNYWIYKLICPFLAYSNVSTSYTRTITNHNSDIFEQWINYNHLKSALLLNSDILYSVSNNNQSINLKVIDGYTKEGLTFFNSNAYSINKDLLSNIPYVPLGSYSEIEFILNILNKNSYIGYIYTSGVYNNISTSIVDILFNSYVNTKKQVIYLNDELTYLYRNSNINLYDLECDIINTYNLIHRSFPQKIHAENDSISIIKIFINNFYRNLSTIEDLALTSIHNGLYAETRLYNLFQKLFENVSLDHRKKFRYQQSILISNFMGKIKEFIDYLFSNYSASELKSAELLSSLYKIYAMAVGEALGTFYLEARSLDLVSPEIERIDKFIEKEIHHF